MDSNQPSAMFWLIYSIVVLLIAVVTIVAHWKMFEKAGEKAGNQSSLYIMLIYCSKLPATMAGCFYYY